jgi:ABC-type multidrug transport system ATPase subunit
VASHSSAPLELDQVRRRFGRRDVVAGVSMALARGEVRLLVGPNGSGKSTLARLAAGLLRPTAGSVRVEGRDPRGDSGSRGTIGFVGHQSLLYEDLTPRENLGFVARLYGLTDREAAVEATLDRTGVGPERATQVRRLSRGMVQRVALARALLVRPTLVILDEPFTGLDTPSSDRLVGILNDLREEGRSILVISHDLEDIWRVPARVTVLKAGEVQFDADTSLALDEFRHRYAEAILA